MAVDYGLDNLDQPSPKLGDRDSAPTSYAATVEMERSRPRGDAVQVRWGALPFPQREGRLRWDYV
jgi:hypothetical protein